MTDPTPETTPARDEAAIWPERLTLRDTKVIADEGQRIFTTATGYGYEKREYVRADLASDPAPASGGVDAVALLRDVANTHTQYCETLHRAADILASLSPTATPVSEAGGEQSLHDDLIAHSESEMASEALLDLAHEDEAEPAGLVAKLRVGALHRDVPAWISRVMLEASEVLAKPASSPAGGGVHEAAIGLLSELDAYCVGSRAYDRRVNEARRALKAALSQSTSAGKANGP